MSSRYSRSRDANEPEIIAALLAAGASVHRVQGDPGFPDLVVGFEGVNYLLEVKNPATRPAGNDGTYLSLADVADGGEFEGMDRALRRKQAECIAGWQGLKPVVVRWPWEALAVIGAPRGVLALAKYWEAAPALSTVICPGCKSECEVFAGRILPHQVSLSSVSPLYGPCAGSGADVAAVKYAMNFQRVVSVGVRRDMCPVCHVRVELRRDGKLRSHEPEPRFSEIRRCPGSGFPGIPDGQPCPCSLCRAVDKADEVLP